MIIRNWRTVQPSIVHDYGIDYKLLKSENDQEKQSENCCMKGMPYIAYAMLQGGKSYKKHSHDDHEEVYYIISGKGKISIDDEVCSIEDGDAIYIPAGSEHSIENSGKDYLTFLAISAKIQK